MRSNLKSIIKSRGSVARILIIIILITSGVYSNGIPSEEELFNLAFELNINGDYEKAADTYEQLLELYPGTNNEGVYRELAVIYGERLLDFSKEMQIYKKYIAVFPEGRLRNRFTEKYNFLEDNRPEWEVIKEYRIIRKTYYNRKVEENIELMERLLAENPESFLVPDIYSWLAWEFHHITDFTRGREYIEKYLATFPENGRPVEEKIDAYNRQAVILTGLHQYREALMVLKKAHDEAPEAFVVYKKKVYTVRKEWFLWTGYLLSLGCFIIVFIVVLWLKPWQRRYLGLKFKYLSRGIIMLFLGSVLPMLIVNHLGYGFWNTFITLAFVESIVIVLINLLSPLAGITGRKPFILVSFLLTLAGIYVSFYLWDTLSVFYTGLGY